MPKGPEKRTVSCTLTETEMKRSRNRASSFTQAGVPTTSIVALSTQITRRRLDCMERKHPLTFVLRHVRQDLLAQEAEGYPDKVVSRSGAAVHGCREALERPSTF